MGLEGFGDLVSVVEDGHSVPSLCCNDVHDSDDNCRKEPDMDFPHPEVLEWRFVFRQYFIGTDNYTRSGVRSIQHRHRY